MNPTLHKGHHGFLISQIHISTRDIARLYCLRLTRISFYIMASSLRRSLLSALKHSTKSHFHTNERARHILSRGYGGFAASHLNQQMRPPHWLQLEKQVNHGNFHILGANVLSKRLYSHGSVDVTSESKISIGPPKADENLVYVGPIAKTVKKVKILSLSTCCLSLSLGPVITFLTNDNLHLAVKLTISAFIMIMSFSTTAALHWFVGPYVHKLRWVPGSDSFEVEQLSWRALPYTTTIKFSDIVPPNTRRPVVTFKANGRYYFIDVDCFKNKELLAKLKPKE